MTRGQQFLTAIQIIIKYEPDAEYAAEHDELWFGSFRPEKMLREDKLKLEELGWSYETYEAHI
jgi:hypothetical protein